MNRISCIMPVFNTDQEIHQMTVEAVESIRNAGDFQLIIVDNGSTFAPGYLKSIADDYIRNETNKGYPVAVNQGLERAKHDLIAISNNDIRLPDNICSVSLEGLKDKEVGSIHFRMIPYDQPFNPGDKLWKTGKERWCTSSFFIIKKEALPEGNYDENFKFGGYDDYDFWHRVRHINGWKTAYTNKAEYQHWGSWTLNKVPESEKAEKNLAYFISKWGEHPDKLFQKRFPKQWEISYFEGFE